VRAHGNTANGYTSPKSLTFGGPSAIGSFTPTVTNSSGTAIPIDSSIAITFSSGVATVSGSSNGLMTLYKAQTVNVTVTDQTISNGSATR
jgi:hypothetical protein